MSWSVGLILDTVEVSDACVDELNELMDDRGQDHIAYENELEFNPDHMEHMDFINGDDEIINIMIKHGTVGVIRFASVEGDNSGEIWEHRFTTDGYSYVSNDLADVILTESDE